jgi:prephenate dehydrogenase
VRIAVIGTGLVGGSIGLALVGKGHDVVGFDRDPERLARAKERGAVGVVAASIDDACAGADVAFVAVPVGEVVEAVTLALDAGVPLVTDVGSVKGPIVAGVSAARPDAAARFLGGHPMAGSEQEGVEGSRADLFVGAAWVLTPTSATNEQAYARLHGLLREVEAEVVTVTPDDHDVLVSFVSHVPQIAASTLMDVTNAREAEHRALLRLASGGFRDMTRIAASHPTIWVDILTSNRDAVLRALDAYIAGLQRARGLVADGDRAELADLLERARAARRGLPVGAQVTGELVTLSVPVADRPGVIAEISTLAQRLGVNIAALYTADSFESGGGVVVLRVDAASADEYEAALRERGYHATRTEPE